MPSDKEHAQPSRIEAVRVQQLFDGLALDYDELCRRKSYPGPVVIRDLLRETLGEAGSLVSILDLGCGTGQLGPVLRPWARCLVGVDLSRQMLVKAQTTNTYDRLEHAEAIEYLNSHQDEYDLIVAAGVFHYFGGLTTLLRSCFESLRSKGTLLFTLAEGPLLGESYYHQPEEYFQHAPQYAMQQLGELGLGSGAVRRILWPSADQHSEYALVFAVQRPEQLNEAEPSLSSE